MVIFVARDPSWRSSDPDNIPDAAVIPVADAADLADLSRARVVFPRAGIVAVLSGNVTAAEAVRAGAHATAPGGAGDRDIAPLVELALAHKAAEDVRDEAIAAMSHELRNPLNVIAITLAYLAEATDLPNDKRRVHMQKVDRAIARMVALLDDVADASFLMRGVLVLAIEPLSAKLVVDEATRVARGAVEARGVGLSCEAPAALSVSADRTRIVKALSSAIHRVAATAPRNGTVHVEAREDGTEVAIAVTGGCPGPVSRSVAFSLDVAARIVTALGGRAWKEDDLERAGALRLTLPKAPNRA